jgi:DNA polymerase I-like protein with 3'-5' exonuclease and polymerase domains
MTWRPLAELPDLRRVGIISLDTETLDERLRADMGSGWPFRSGHLCGVSVAHHAEAGIQGYYFPIRHPDSQNFEPGQVYRWMQDHIDAGVRFVTQNGLYDWGWLRTEAGIKMPDSAKLEEIGALATMVDENRFQYSLDALCAWRGIAGKDEALLREGIAALALHKNKRRKLKPQNYIAELPAHYVGPYTEADAVSTLALFDDLNPILDLEGTREAYRLEADILPMVLEMRLRGIRIDIDAAERACTALKAKRDAALAKLSEQLGCAVGMDELQGRKWLVETFDREGVKYPRTEKGNPSFKAGKSGWMVGHKHWLPAGIAIANKYNEAVTDFLEKLLVHTVNGRIHAEINPHRSEGEGTKSFRFSYSNPPLQQMPKRDEELGPLIRGVFLPEEDEVWATPDASQQEFRLVVHYANQHRLPRAAEAVARYRDDPDTDFHAFAASITGLDRKDAKAVNFAKIYGAGVKKFAAMIGRPESEAKLIFERYDRELPFLSRLSKRYAARARKEGYITLYDGARRHFNRFAPVGTWAKGAGPCEREEAHARTADPDHPWYKKQLERADTHTALNALIQGSAARHTKRWMRMCWREGIVPLLQMHDCLECSVATLEQAEMVARLGAEAIELDVPMKIDLKFGRTWGDASHSWGELHGDKPAEPELIYVEPSEAPAIDKFDVLAFCKQCGQPLNGADRTYAYDGAYVHPGCLKAYAEERFEEAHIPAEPASTPEHAFLASQDMPEPDMTTESHGPNGANGSAPHAGNGADSSDGYPPHGKADRDTGREKAFYVYHRADGSPYLGVKRTSTKQFPQFHWVDGKWLPGSPNGPRIPYHLPELIKTPPEDWVLICAGEKDTDSAIGLGFTATTNPEGERKGAWVHELSAWFGGRKHVAIMEDNDKTGRAHAVEVATALRGLVGDIRIVPFRELPEHGDLTDWLEQGHSKAELLARIEAAKPDQPKLKVWNVCELLGTGLPPPRGWLYGRQLCRGFLSGLVAPGDAGKTTLRLTQAVELATGRELLGHRIHQRCRVLIVCLEDDHNELWRRLLAVCLHHGVDRSELDGWLFCTTVNGPKLAERGADGERRLGALDAMLRSSIDQLHPDLLILDPFVKLHALIENDNADMDFVCIQLVKIAHDHDMAVDCPAHTRKGELEAGNADNRRGASAQRDASRLDYTLAHMTEEEAKRFSMDLDERKDYVRLDRAKANIVRRSIKASWFHMVSVNLGNATEQYPDGDEVQALEVWMPPEIWADITDDEIDAILDDIKRGMDVGNRYSEAPNAKDRAAWKVVQDHCPDKAEAQCREIIKTWVKDGVLVTREYTDPERRAAAKGLFVEEAARGRARGK